MPNTAVKTRWVDGNLVFYDAAGAEIMTINGVSRKVSFPAGSTLENAGTSTLAAGSILKTNLAGGFLKLNAVAGQDETGDTTIPVTGLAVGDELVAVFVLATAAAIATLAQRALADFTVGAGVVNVVANAANNAANQYLIVWLDLT